MAEIMGCKKVSRITMKSTSKSIIFPKKGRFKNCLIRVNVLRYNYFMSQQPNDKLVVLPILIFSILFLFTIFKIGDFDIWFHMKAGQIITETDRFIYKDIFTYTAGGREWIYHEWLFGVLVYNIYNALGANGIIIGKAIVLTLTFLLLYKCMRIRGVNSFIASFVLFLAVLAARFRLTERPHTFKYLFVAAFIYLLDIYRLRGKNYLYLLPFIQILWVNIHGSFILGPSLIGIYLLSAILPLGKKALKNIFMLITILIMTSLATLINPYGLKIISFSLKFSEQPVLSVINEWRPTRLAEFYGTFGLIFITGAISFMMVIMVFKRFNIGDVLLYCIFSYLSIKAIRFTALFSLATAPIMAGNLQQIAANINFTPLKKRFLLIIFLFTTVLLSILEVKRYPELIFDFGIKNTYPQEAVEFIKQNNLSGNMYNFSAFGGYLIWNLYPDRRVFIDGRPEIYEKDFQQAFIVSPSIVNWNKAVSVYDINYAIVAYVESKVDRIGGWIANDPNWVLIYWDNKSRIYIKNIPTNHEIINKYSHQILKNGGVYFNYETLKDIIKTGHSKILEAELKNDIQSNSNNAIAWYWLGMLYSEIGNKKEAMQAWKEVEKNLNR